MHVDLGVVCLSHASVSLLLLQDSDGQQHAWCCDMNVNVTVMSLTAISE